MQLPSPTARIPLDTWMVVEPITYNEIKPVSTHATQYEAEAECDRRNRGWASRATACASRSSRSPSAWAARSAADFQPNGVRCVRD